jgi:hypothetical protein
MISLHAEACGDFLSADLKITKLMEEYAEKDQHYKGTGQGISEDSSPTEDKGPPRPALMYLLTACWGII